MVNKDAFGLEEVSSPQLDFDAQLTYDAQPLMYELVKDNGDITYDATNGCLNISNEGAVGHTYLQTLKYFTYKPGIGKKIFITFNFKGNAAGSVHYAQYGDDDNAIGLKIDEYGNLLGYIKSTTSEGYQEKSISKIWHGIDIEKEQILVIQFEALYVGSVQIGLQLVGDVKWLVTFDNANRTNNPYIRTANLPVRVGIISSGVTPTDMIFNCTSVQNMGDSREVTGFDFYARGQVVAGNDTDTHAISIRPKALFKGITNRVNYTDIRIAVKVIGNNPIRWKLALGQVLTSPNYTDINPTYSSMESVSGATMSGDPAIEIEADTVGATAQSKGGVDRTVDFKYPITLDAAGNPRDLGTLTLIVNGVGGTSACDCYIYFREVR